MLEVNTELLARSAEEIAHNRSTILEAAAELQQSAAILASFDRHGLLTTSLKAISSDLESEAAQTSRMAQTLLQISNYYQNCEKATLNRLMSSAALHSAVSATAVTLDSSALSRFGLMFES